MRRYLSKRIAATIPVVLGVLTLTFFLIHLVPGDPIDIMLGEQATTIDKDALRAELGLNLPIKTQYKNFLTNLIQFDLGRSLHSRRPVIEEILERVPATIELTFASLFFAILLGVPLGILASIRQYGTFDNIVSVFGLLGMSIPSFWLGPMLIWIFAISLDIFPVSERGGLDHLVLPAVSLGLALAAILMRMTRASMLEVIKEDYIRVAKAKGLSNFKVYFKHALANALMPIITILGLQFGALLTGAVITETIFDWPGIGTLFFRAIQERNYPLVQGCVLFISLTYVSVNFFTDLSYGFVNPKIRLS